MRRSAITRAEVIVVVVVLLVLAGLFVSGVHAAREAARRSQCISNLKMMSFACLLHESTKRVLPNAGYDRGSQNSSIPTFLGPDLEPAVADKQQAGWSYQILPYLSQANLWEGRTGTTLKEKQALAASGALYTYFCPTRRRPTEAQGRGLIDYAAASTCSGLLADLEDPKIDLGVDCAIVRNRNTLKDIEADDVFHYSISAKAITDGTSHVMLISEKQVNLANTPPAEDDDQGYCVGHDIDNMRTCVVPPSKDYFDPNEGKGGGNRVYRFGSSHPGLIVVSMCDGSVRTVSYQVDQQTFLNLGRRKDGAKLNLDQY